MFAGALVGAWLLRYSLALPIAVSGAISGVCALAAYGPAGGPGSSVIR
jgi:hypothetical protein